MDYVNLKGVRVPALGLGTWQLSDAQCADVVRAGLAMGYRHVDTAQAYKNEDQVGLALADSDVPRDEIFLTTKVWHERLEADDLKRSVDESLTKLRTDHVDLLLIHWPNPEFPLGRSLEALAEVKARGKARQIGVSNFPVALLREAIERHGADLLCDQIEYHPFLSQKPILEFARAHDLMVTAYSPIARGEVAAHPVLTRIGERHGKSAVQVTLRWLIDQPNVAAIPKASGEKHLRSNFEIFDFKLTDEDRAEIDGLLGDRRLVNPGWAPEWDPA
ncbi:2,5-didehydrogluconate reductase [Skermanella stibiiresistens SB22]|uniref:2,5-didehydrogluconate reductase n=1 Tax=Skermanella stibiiresistens SB22 TaxID=1385369 RepID=W9GRI3_9PROT|nr:aldo/keto reductase [Skermanella stibiiresistens]EWY36364.1 2,5-didehydrogluconate reductase [Skermanella stibiiresistens SB22]